jgi:hypothetical protein
MSIPSSSLAARSRARSHEAHRGMKTRGGVRAAPIFALRRETAVVHRPGTSSGTRTRALPRDEFAVEHGASRELP